jgi:hypothetical protein
MRTRLEGLKGTRVALKNAKGEMIYGVLCKALQSATFPDEWFILSMGVNNRFVLGDIASITTPYYQPPMIILKSMLYVIPTMPKDDHALIYEFDSIGIIIS